MYVGKKWICMAIKLKNQSTLSSCKVLTIAPTSPKYSEAWMERMNDGLQPNHIFVAIANKKEQESVNHLSLSKDVGLPEKLHYLVFGSKIRKNLKEILDSVNDDAIILCHYLTTAVLLWDILRKTGKQIFVHCHGHDVTWERRLEKFPIIPAHGLFYKKNVQKLIGKVKLISNSDCTSSKLRDIGFTSESIYVNHLTVDLNQFKPSFKSEQSTFRYLYLGRLVDFKGPLETIQAFEKACDLGVVAELDIVGDGPLMKECIRLTNSSKYKSKIHLHGAKPKEEVMSFLSKADVLTAHNKKSQVTGQEEAFGVSIIEAMSMQLPVITGASGGVLETVRNGVTGFLFEPLDINAHAEYLKILATNSEVRYRMGEEGRKRVSLLFNSDKESKQIKSILGINSKEC